MIALSRQRSIAGAHATLSLVSIFGASLVLMYCVSALYPLYAIRTGLGISSASTSDDLRAHRRNVHADRLVVLRGLGIGYCDVWGLAALGVFQKIFGCTRRAGYRLRCISDGMDCRYHRPPLIAAASPDFSSGSSPEESHTASGRSIRMKWPRGAPKSLDPRGLATVRDGRELRALLGDTRLRCQDG